MPATAPPSRVALVVGGSLAATAGPSGAWVGPIEQVGDRLRDLAPTTPRWVLWSAQRDAAPLLRVGVRLERTWDLAEVHRLVHGRWSADPGTVWAATHGLAADTRPVPAADDLFTATGPLAALAHDALTLPDGHLRPDAWGGGWTDDPDHLLAWARAALDCADRQDAALSDRQRATTASESAASVLCVELERDGLPVDRATLESLIAGIAGPRPRDAAHADGIRRERDAAVLVHAPGHEGTDLRNPAQVRALLRAVGVDVPNTRKWTLDPYRGVHPLVEALLRWRKAERIATTYGHRWVDRHVGADDRLRGHWTACDGAAGRMTAENGLHSLPAELRPGVAAAPGHLLVRADLGQIEPRVLAVVARDESFAAATRADDLYQPVAARLGVDRSVAKVAVLAAMYGQRSGAAGEALKGLERAFPVAMSHLDEAYAAGLRGEDVLTHGGRRVRTSGPVIDTDPAAAAARGRYARNAIIQGSAAELFKAWAATVRATTADLGAEVVLCLHDELLIHVPEQHASACAERVDAALTDAARRWSEGAPVRFVADTTVIRRWSDAKG